MKPKQNKELKTLLARFEKGETNRVEEERLNELLQLEENKNNFSDEAELFAYFKTAKKETANTSLVQEIFDKTQQFQNSSENSSNAFHVFYKYAAILIIALGMLHFAYQYQQDKIQKEEARMAYLETKKALFIISEEMNNATDKLSEIEDFTQQTQKYINP
ncbi:hypothetical protein [Psychroflexus planctonicus]|uniref:Anti-sigma factor n=1 Tax=Psychroflexus planctonicus TaxID=1526575 RepID=A0ABQ1SGL8_9FLAO|nr:hypothetical protein [Psychroflexus planctonicus]GGE29791.1 hypothetical protein GCM10010832_07880 [Psychroflexus planctonicus]